MVAPVLIGPVVGLKFLDRAGALAVGRIARAGLASHNRVGTFLLPKHAVLLAAVGSPVGRTGDEAVVVAGDSRKVGAVVGSLKSNRVAEFGLEKSELEHRSADSHLTILWKRIKKGSDQLAARFVSL